MEEPPSSSGEASLQDPPRKKFKRKNLNLGECEMIKNVYEGIREKWPNMLVEDAVEMCGFFTKVCSRTIYPVLKKNREHVKENIEKQDLQCNKNSHEIRNEIRGRPKVTLDQHTKYAIRRKIHGYFFRNEIPTIQKILQAIREDDSLPKISLRILLRTLREMNIKYLKRNRKSALIEKKEIVLWRRKFLEQIEEHRRAGRKIYYTDETWLNEGHTKSKVWQDLNITNLRQAFLDGFSTGLKAPSGKGRRLIITHIGSDSGFLIGGLNVFESRKTGDYHEDMNAEVFEKWFSSILELIEPGSVIVMDNASYHSRRVESTPTSLWRKGQIINWLHLKNIEHQPHMLKVQLLDIARLQKAEFTKYVIDEMARERGVTVLRLPPYHCELNPIELIWAQIKNQVASKNTTFKLKDLKSLLQEAIADVNEAAWKKCIAHVQKEEKKMWDLDTRVEVLTEPLVISPGMDSSSSEDSLSE